MSLGEASPHPRRATDTTGQYIYSLVNADGEVVQGVALVGPDEAQLAKLEDTAHSDGDPGLMLLGVRKDAAVALAGADGDYIPIITDRLGRLHVAPGAPDITVMTDTVSASGDTELIAAPGANTRIVISSIVIQNESASPLTIILKDGSTAKRRFFGQNQGGGLSTPFRLGKEWRLAENSALNINLSGAQQCGYTIDYWTEPT